MGKRQLRLALLGDLGGPVGKALAGIGTALKYDSSLPLSETDVVVVDNLTAGPQVPLDAGAVERLVAAGKAVGFVDITAEQCGLFRNAIAIQPAAGQPFFLASRGKAAAGHRLDRVGVVARPPDIPPMMLRDEAGVSSTVPQVQTAPDREAVAASIAEIASSHFDVDQTAGGLLPPAGTTFAQTQHTTAFAATPVSQTSWTAGSGTVQNISSSYTLQLFLYYANGGGGNAYNVICIMQAASSPGTLVQNTGNARYFIQAEVMPQMQLAAATPNVNAVTLIAHGPGTTVGPQVVDAVSVPMSFPDRGVSTPFNAVYNPPGYQIPNWSVNDQSNPGAQTASWLFYESSVWNPVASIPSDYNVWWQQMYDGNNNVVALPAQSQLTFNDEVVAAWTVGGNANNAGQLNVTLTFTLSQWLFGFANQTGTGNGHHQILSFQGPLVNSQPVTFDLIQAT